jgi:filamentous hemagglutinin family protein
MNHIYRSIWNEALGVWVAVSEHAKGQGKRSIKRNKLLMTGLLVCSSPVFALPTGNQLVAGQATVSSNPAANQMQINQASQRAAINWQGFSIAPHETVNIQQPNANAALLNRVVGQDASQIQGKLNANGQVYLVNPNGVIFSKTARVDVGGLVATTHNISNQDFMNGKNHFTQDGAKGTVENHGTITTKEGGIVALIGEKVTNTGTINTPKGTTALAAGKTVDLDFQGDGLVEVKVSEAALKAQIDNKGAIIADGGRVVMTTKAAGQLVDTVINQDGIVKAQGLVERNGEIILTGDYVAQTGALDVSGKTGGKVDIQARAILDTGKISADSTTSSGGNINLKASDAIIQTATAETHANGTTTGGTVHLEAANSVYSSGKLSSTGDKGGTVNIVSNNRVVLAAADVDASGKNQGGLIHVGGDFHGVKTKLSNNAKTTIINSATKLKTDGGKGKVVVWSDEKTDYHGSISANQGGEIEVSSKGTLNYAGTADAGIGGELLLDPKNIIISNTGSVASYALIDPHAAANNNFGANTALLGTTVGGVFDSKLKKIVGGTFTENGNIAVSSPGDDLAANNAGAVYLFNTTTGALLSTLTGASTNDQIGSRGITALTNGNYVVSSPSWNFNRGAATWGNGVTGISGAVSSANSLVGSNGNNVVTGDSVSSGGITALSNGNYVVNSSFWGNHSEAGVGVVTPGAVTWGDGATGSSGVVSAANSLIGSFDDHVGSGGVTALTNGNYVVSSQFWDRVIPTSTILVDAGAVTWGNGATGTRGVVSETNSLVGSATNDQVASNGVTALTNGNYVVSSSNWNVGCTGSMGAATWGNGATAGTRLVGTISTANSLTGSTFGDSVASNGVIALTNGNYVVSSSDWDNNINGSNEGAVTWGNGVTGISGTVSSSNSLVGDIFGDSVGSNGITVLTNGNYVVSSPNWNIHRGAATWGNGNGGTVGAISSDNSLIGSFTNSQVSSGGITTLSNGNYVVASPNLLKETQVCNGTFCTPFLVANVGAATWGNGLTGTFGLVRDINSLVGSLFGDSVGSGGVTALTNGNYVVRSPDWHQNPNSCQSGSLGAVTWGNGTTVTSDTISATNSLVGSVYGDNIGSNGVKALTNGNYVVSSPYWSNGALTNVGAATWGNGVTAGTRLIGTISAANSLIGSTANDNVGSYYGVTALANGNYVVSSDSWHNGTTNYAGAATWGNGVTGTSGIVSTINSLTGSVSGDFGAFEDIYTVTGLSNGNYVISSDAWDNASLVNTGQVRVVTTQNIFFNNGLGQNMIFNPSIIADTLALGTNITLQASNDITLDTGTDILVGGSNGGTLTLQAGRNLTLNSNIVTANGNFTAIAGDPNAIAADRDAGTPTLTLGASINAGLGRVILAAINGNFVYNPVSTPVTPLAAFSPTLFDTAALPSSAVTATTPTVPITASQWFIYSTDPRLNTLNGLAADFKHYGQSYTGITPSYAVTGNWFFYSVTPVLTVSPASQAINYGTSPANFSYLLSGFIDGDTIDKAGISGTPAFNIGGGLSSTGYYLVGSHDVAYLSGLLSNLGYSFIDNALSSNELTVVEQPAVTPTPTPTPIPTVAPTPTVIPTLIVDLQDQLTPLQVSVTAIKNPDKPHNPPGELEILNDGMNLAFLMDQPYTIIPHRHYICEWRPGHETYY